MEAKTFTIPKKYIRVIEDALRIALATVTQEYFEKPSIELAKRKDELMNALDIIVEKKNGKL